MGCEHKSVLEPVAVKMLIALVLCAVSVLSMPVPDLDYGDFDFEDIDYGAWPKKYGVISLATTAGPPSRATRACYGVICRWEKLAASTTAPTARTVFGPMKVVQLSAASAGNRVLLESVIKCIVCSQK